MILLTFAWILCHLAHQGDTGGYTYVCFGSTPPMSQQACETLRDTNETCGIIKKED